MDAAGLSAAAVLTLCGGACGRAMAGARRLRHLRLDALTGAVARLSLHMLEGLLPLKEALARTDDPVFAAVSAQLSEGRAARAAWEAAKPALTARGGALAALTDADTAALDRFFEGAGRVGLDEQRLLLEETRAALARQADVARALSRDQSRLYGSLGLLAGLAFSILLI